MSTAVQLRRGTTAQHASFTGAVGEVTVDTTKDTVVVHDGVLAGGHPLLKESAFTSALGTTIVEQTSASGSAIIPSGDASERDGSPAAGYFRFNVDVAKFEGYNGTAWGSVGGGATGGGGDEAFFENDVEVSANYTITTGKNAMSAGPMTIADGVTVTVPDGSVWTIV
jgi:hypothetical protein